MVVERQATTGCQESFISERLHPGDTGNFFWVYHYCLWPFAFVPFIVDILTYPVTRNLTTPSLRADSDPK